jgi:hypothetical protein
MNDDWQRNENEKMNNMACKQFHEQWTDKTVGINMNQKKNNNNTNIEYTQKQKTNQGENNHKYI